MQPTKTPQSPRKPRRDGWTAERRQAFFGHLAAGLDVKRACALVGLSRQKAYTLRGRDAAFAAAWDEARRGAREGADEAFLAMLPERLRAAMSELSGSRERRTRQTPSRTVSGVSAPCHHRGDGISPLDTVPGAPSVSPSPCARPLDGPETKHSVMTVPRAR